MIIGAIEMTRVIAACLVIVLSGYQSAYAIQLQGLLEKMASTTEKSALFTETKTAYFLKNPLVSKGTLEFKSPSTLIKRITDPELLEQKIEGGVLSIYQGTNRKKALSLTPNYELAVGVNAILWVLSGSFDELNNNFHITFIDDVNNWTIELVPKDSELISKIAIILLKGTGGNINLIDIQHSNGNSIKTVLYGHQ